MFGECQLHRTFTNKNKWHAFKMGIYKMSPISLVCFLPRLSGIQRWECSKYFFFLTIHQLYEICIVSSCPKHAKTDVHVDLSFSFIEINVQGYTKKYLYFKKKSVFSELPFSLTFSLVIPWRASFPARLSSLVLPHQNYLNFSDSSKCAGIFHCVFNLYLPIN